MQRAAGLRHAGRTLLPRRRAGRDAGLVGAVKERVRRRSRAAPRRRRALEAVGTFALGTFRTAELSTLGTAGGRLAAARTAPSALVKLQRLQLQLLLDELFHVGHQPRVLARDQRHG